MIFNATVRTYALAWLIGIAGWMSAAEIDPATIIRNQAKTTWAEAVKANDIWSCLQLEEWGREQKPPLRLGPVLGSSVIHGNPLFAVPETLRLSADFGDRILISGERRVWVIAPDGRPLQAGAMLATHGWSQVASWDGSVVASGRRVGNQLTIDAGSTRIADGKVLLRGSMGIVDVQGLDGIGAVADDGSAIAMTVTSDNAIAAPPRQICVITTRGGDPLHFPRLSGAFAVGRGGAWLAGYSQRGETLARGDERLPIGYASPGPGMLACILQTKPTLILPDGKDVPLNPGRAVGKNPMLLTVGGWLAMITGDEAKGVSSGGMMGDDEGKVIDLPISVLLWRWSDLLANANAVPSKTIIGHAWRADDRVQSLWLWNDKSIEELDLAGLQPIRRPYLQAPGRISWPWTSGNCLIIKIGGSRHLVYGPDKSLLWDGDCDSIWVRRPNLAVTRRIAKGDVYSYQLQHLAADSTARKEVNLVVPPIDQEFLVEFRRRDCVVFGPPTAWRRFDLTGKLIDEGVTARPSITEWDLPRGRFFRDHARLFPKALPDPEAFEDRLLPRDAWRSGQIEVLLDRHRTVFTTTKSSSSSKKRAVWSSLGQVPYGDHLAMASGVLVVAGSDGIAQASLINGPALNLKLPNNVGSTDFANGPWRINDMQFIPPRGREYTWDDRLGFFPIRLRGPDEANMLVVTSSVLIELEPDAAKMVGRTP
ncbi:MAG: hypothetical protein AAB263_05630 [Planctomycetota bacterium]